MYEFNPENFGERWIRALYRRFQHNKWLKYSPVVCIAISAICTYVMINSGSYTTFSLLIGPMIVSLLSAIDYWEKWHITRIINRQQEQIERLKVQLNAITSQPKNASYDFNWDRESK